MKRRNMIVSIQLVNTDVTAPKTIYAEKKVVCI